MGRKPRQDFVVGNSRYADVDRGTLGPVEARERFGTSFTVDVTPERAAGYESCSPVTTHLGCHNQIMDGEEFWDLGQDFRR